MNRELFKQFILEHVKSAEEAEEIVRYLTAVNWRAAWSETVAIRKEVMRDGDHYACFLPLSEHNRIQAHLSRAKDAGTEASLTDAERRAAREYLHYKCAYCRTHPYEVLEHYLPISLGGGTYHNNCIPACTTCNNRKKRTSDTPLETLFPPANVARIQTSLTQQKKVTLHFQVGRYTHA